jgi:AraC-like DNA-binding protein
MFRECDYVVIGNEVHTTRSFFTNYFSQGNETFQQWAEGQYRKSPHMEFYQTATVSIGGAQKRVYEYSVSVPYTSIQKTRGSIHVLIDERSIKKVMDSAGILEFSYIADTRGRMASFFSDKYREAPQTHNPANIGEASGHFVEKSETGKNIIYYTHSKDGQWVFSAAQSLESMLGAVNKIRNFFLPALVISVLLALVISLLFAWRKARPLSGILNSLREYSLFSAAAGGTEKSQLKVLKRSVMTLISENSAIRDEMERQRPIVQNVFLSRVLRGEVSDEEEIRKNLAWMKIRTDGRNLIVVLGFWERLEAGQESAAFSGAQAMKAVLSDMVQLCSKEVSFLEADLDENTAAFIGIAPFFDAQVYTDYCRKFFSEIRDRLSGEFLFPVRFAVGQPTDIFSRLYYSFDTARYAQENSLLRCNNSGITVFDPAIKQQSRYEYSMSEEMRLINFVREGNMGGIQAVLNCIFEGRNINTSMDNESLKLLLAAIKNTLFRLNSIMFSADPQVYSMVDEQIMKIEHFDKTEIVGIFETLCRIMRKKRDTSESKLKQNILEYIRQNYRHNDFYLGSLTVHFKLSETYLSLFFKECTGENFTAYVEKLRLRDACGLLKKISIPIDTIASSVGYSSAHAFRRAFKRRFGISPTEYRRSRAEAVDKISGV